MGNEGLDPEKGNRSPNWARNRVSFRHPGSTCSKPVFQSCLTLFYPLWWQILQVDQNWIGECDPNACNLIRKNFQKRFRKKKFQNIFETEKKICRNSGIAKKVLEKSRLHPFLKMIRKRLRDYDRSPVFSSRFQNLAGEHGTVGFKNKPDNFVRDGCIPVNQPVTKRKWSTMNCWSIQQARGCSGLPG